MKTLLIIYVRDCKLYSARVHERGRERCFGSVNCWVTPPAGVLKLNTDAAILHGGEVGLGVAAKDSTGCLMFTGTKCVRGYWDLGIAKAATKVYGLELAKRLGYNVYGLKVTLSE